MAGVQFSQEAARRIAAATRKVERTPVDRAGDRSGLYDAGRGFWAMVHGNDVSGIRYSFSKVVFDPLSAMPEAFTISNTLRFGFDGASSEGYTAIEVNGTRGVRPFTVVWMSFAGYGTAGEPIFMFSHPNGDPSPSLPPHDHRDNLNGGFAFATFHPGTGLPQMPFGL